MFITDEFTNSPLDVAVNLDYKNLCEQSAMEVTNCRRNSKFLPHCKVVTYSELNCNKLYHMDPFVVKTLILLQ